MTGEHDAAVIGLGAMGLPMAGRLAERLSVAAFDVDPARLQRAGAAGIAAAVTPATAVAGARVVVLALRTGEQTAAALFGESGAAPALAPGAVVLMTSTIGAAAARELAGRLDEVGATLLDAPVSGGAARAGRGELLVFLGGAQSAVQRARPVLDLLATTTVHVGPNAGDGQSMKMVNQLLCGVHVAAAAEALALADGLGLDLDRTLEAMLAGAAASFMLENRGPRIVEVLRGGEPDVLSRVDIFVKDMGLVAETARAGEVPVPLAGAAEQLYRLAAAAGLAAADDASLARLYRSETSTDPA